MSKTSRPMDRRAHNVLLVRRRAWKYMPENHIAIRLSEAQAIANEAHAIANSIKIFKIKLIDQNCFSFK